VVHRATYHGQAVAVSKLLLGAQLRPHELAEFEQEVQLSAGLRHPNVLLLLGVAASPLMLVTELCPAGSLYQCLHKDKSLQPSPAEALGMMRDLAAGLSYLHSKRVMHRDLKSLNVLVGDNNRLKICDFGCSTLKGSEAYSNYTRAGTPTWMAPEIWERKGYSYPADIYSLGLIFYELAAGALPFEGWSEMELFIRVAHEGERPSFKGTPRACPPAMQELIERMWDHAPGMRPEIAQVLAAVQAACEAAGV
jgi:serine/threonine protein kinase